MGIGFRRAALFVRLSCASTFGIVTGPVLAQAVAADAEDGAADVVVLGKGYGLPVGKTLTALKDTPNSVTVIEQDRIRAQNLFTLEDALTATTGITIGAEGSEDPAYLSRGFELNNFLVDGVASRALAFPVPVPDLFFYDRVEVLRGPAGLFNGAGSPAGSINLIRKRPLRETAADMAAGYGSFANYRTQMDVSVPLGPTAGVRFGALGQDDGQFYDGAGRRRLAGFANGELRIGTRTVLSAGASYDDLRTSIQSGLPGLQGGDDGSEGSLLEVDRATFLGGDWNRGRYRTWNAFAEVTHEATDRVLLKATGLLLDLDRTDRYTLIPFSPLTAVSPANGGNIPVSGIRGDYGVRAYAVDLNGVGTFDAFGRSQTIIVGADYQSRNQTLASANRVAYARINVFDPVSPPEPPLDPYVALPPVNGVAQSRFANRSVLEQYGIYGQLRLSPLAGLTLLGGGRVTWVDSETRTIVPVASPAARQSTEGRFTPYAGVVVDATDRLNLYASYTDNFEPQTANAPQADGGAIDPLVGTQYEGGMKYALAGDRLVVSAAAFQITQKNRLFTDPALPTVVFQIGRVRARGAELEAQGEVTRGWRVSAGYAYTRTRTLEDTNPALEGQSFAPVIPRHSLKGFTNYTAAQGPLRGASIGGGVTWLSGTSNGVAAAFRPDGTLLTRSTIVRQGSYALLDLRAGYRFTDALSLTVNGTNVLDRTYYARINSTRRGNLYGQPRAIFATLRYTVR